MAVLKRKQFDYNAERGYYASPVSVIRPYAHLRGHLEVFGEDFCSLFRNKAILDFGGGEGLHSRLIATTCDPKFIAVTDLFLHRISYPSACNEFRCLKFLCGDCFHLPFRDASFDVVFGSGILHHFRDLDRALAEVSRVLRRPGRYLGIEPNFASPVVWAVRLGTKKSRNEWEPFPRVLREAFARNGFKIKSRFFWRRVSWLRWFLLTPTVALDAQLS